MRVTKPREERKAELVSAARLLFDKKGVNATRVSDIVKEVGVAQGVFYYYFNSKEAMVNLVVEQVGEEINAQADEISCQQASFQEKLARLVQLYLNLVDQFLGDDETKIDMDANMKDQYPLLEHSQELLSARIVALIQSACRSGELQLEYPEETAWVLILGFRSLAKTNLPSQKAIFTIMENALRLPPNSLKQYMRKKAKP